MPWALAKAGRGTGQDGTGRGEQVRAIVLLNNSRIDKFK